MPIANCVGVGAFGPVIPGYLTAIVWPEPQHDDELDGFGNVTALPDDLGNVALNNRAIQIPFVFWDFLRSIKPELEGIDP